MAQKKYLPKNEILKKWIKRGYSGVQIARRYNVSPNIVNTALRKTGIREKRNFPITTALANFMNGLLLGDGCINIHQLYRKSSLKPKSVKYRHSDKNGTYLLWLKKAFETFGLVLYPVRQTNNTYYLESFFTPELSIFREKWYPDGKKEIPDDTIFAPITLFNFYIGDGSYTKEKYRNLSIAKYDLCWRRIISERLHQLGIGNSINSKCIRVKAKSHDKFFQYICEIPYFIPEAYKYKFSEEYIQYNRVWALIEKFKSFA